MRVPKRILQLLVRPIETFFRTEALGGTVLMLAALVAIVWANSPFADVYNSIWSAQLTVGTPGFGLSKPVILWVNDFLMAIFFLVVGLEIKRELLIGELNTKRNALLPVIAAIGGMVMPALIFLVVAPEAPASRGWGMPMATDIAFALGCLRLLGKKIPIALVVFLTALAIIDDLGAIVVIALFYTTDLSVSALGIAAFCSIVLVTMNILGVRRPWLYVVAGIPLWVAILKSGVHSTIAGVIVGLCVPASALFSKEDVMRDARDLLGYAEKELHDERDAALSSLEHRLKECDSPLARLEHALHPWVAYVIVPIFALANAGVSLVGVGFSDLLRPTSLGVLLGLVIGKQVGVFGASYVAVRSGAASLPRGVSWRHIYGASLLAGIGFTMSLFVGGLAYGEGTEHHIEAKLGILAASLICGIAGFVVLSRSQSSESNY